MFVVASNRNYHILSKTEKNVGRHSELPLGSSEWMRKLYNQMSGHLDS